MNDFEKICKRLNDAKRCGCCESGSDNTYICARNAVKNYIMNDLYKLLKLKGELKCSDYGVNLSIMIAFLGAIMSVLTFVFTIVSHNVSNKQLIDIYGCVLLGVVIFFMMYILQILNKYTGVLKWSGYVQVAVEEIVFLIC